MPSRFLEQATIIREGKPPIHFRTDVFSTQDAWISIHYPEKISQEDIGDFIEWLEIFKRKMKRIAAVAQTEEQRNSTPTVEGSSPSGSDGKKKRPTGAERRAGDAISGAVTEHHTGASDA